MSAPEWDLLEKTELRIERVELEHADLTAVATTVADVLGVGHDEVLVIDARDDLLALDILRRTIVGDSKPENVILLEIEPEKQKTRIDFAATEALLGIQSICVTRIKKRGRELFYDRDGRETRIVLPEMVTLLLADP